jgi:hypothetical protein
MKNSLWVKVTKPISYIVNRLRPKEFQDEQHNLETGILTLTFLTINFYSLTDHDRT